MPPLIRDFLCGTASALGIPGDDIARLRGLTEEVCRYVIEQSFDPGDNGQFQMSLWRRTDSIELVVEDRGLPLHFDQQAPLDRSQAALLPLRAYADEVRFHNLGKQGKRLEFSCRLDAETIEQIVARESASPVPDSVGEDNVTLRMMTAADVVRVSQCIYRSYGLSYYRESLYYPAKIVAMLQRGQLESCIAITDSGRIAGHLAIFYDRSDAKVCETGVAVVDPQFRGHRLFEKMKVMAGTRAIERGMYGIYSDAVTAHPYSQRSNLALGARETGVLLAYLPDRVLFKKIKEVESPARGTSFQFFLRVCPIPEAEVFLPVHHAALIEEIYARLDVPRRIIKADSNAFESVRGLRTQYDLEHKPETSLIYLRINSYGSDVLLVIHNILRDVLQRNDVACVHLLLPLREPLTELLCKGMESFGFFFSSILIEYDHGDFLRLQYLNNLIVNPADIKVASDFGQKLLDYVLDQREVITRNAI